MKSRVVKVMLALYFVLLALVLFMLRESAASGYELSIYENTPLLTWFFVIGSIITGTGIIIHQALSRSKSNWWWLGFSMLIMANLIILFLPALRGYFVSNFGDPINHRGVIVDILNTGHLGDYNFYPFMHILIFDINQICNIPLETIFKYLSGFISLLAMIYMYLLATAVLGKREQVLLVAAASVPLLSPLVQSSIYSQSMPYLAFPLVFYLYFRILQSPSLGYKVVFLILLVAYPFLHPHSALILLAFLITMELARYIYDTWRSWDKKVAPSLGSSFKKISINPILVSFITLFMWISTFDIFMRLNALVATIRGEAGIPGHIYKGLGALNLEGVALVDYFLRGWGHLLIYGVVSVIAVVIILRKVVKGDPGMKILFLMLIWAGVGELFNIFFFVSIRMQSMGRLISVSNAALLSPIFVGFALYYLLRRTSLPSVLRVGAAVLIITLSATVGIFSLYRSPYIYQSSWQATRMDFQATEWFLDHKRPGTLYTGLGFIPNIPRGLLGLESEYTMEDYSYYEYEWSFTPYGAPPYIYTCYLILPEHFGYHDFDALGEQYDQERYLGIGERFRVANANAKLRQSSVAFPMLVRYDFDADDLRQLEHDPTVSKLYSNGELDIMLIRDTGKK